jgi:hypothetical protein
MLPYNQMRGRVLSSTVPAHRMCQTLLIVFTFCDAGLHTHEGSIALKYRACAQNVSSATHVLLHFEMLPYTQIWGQVVSSTVPAHRMCQVLLQFFHFGMLPHTQIRGQVVSSTEPAHRMCQELLQVVLFIYGCWPTRSSTRKRACMRTECVRRYT